MKFATTAILTLIPYLVILGLCIYALVLFIMLAKRGIRALDIYIEEKTNKNQ